MKVAVVAPSPVPFTIGGAERAWRGIVDAINDGTEHVCELLKVPSPERDLAELVRSYRMFLGLDVTHFDLVLTSKYPAWMVNHPEHDIYLFHRLRGLYDTYPGHLPARVDVADRRVAEVARILRTPPTREGAYKALDLAEALVERWPDDPVLGHPGPLGRELVHYLDSIGFAPDEGRRYFSLSDTVARRPGYFPPRVGVEVLELPSNLAGLGPGTYERFFTASRLDGPKRLDLLIEAYRRVPGDVPLLIAGSGPEEARLRELAAGDDRVQLLGFVTDEQLAEHYRRALAVPFIPLDEDWGLIAVEAMASATPVVTCTDSGGPADLVDDGVNGFVVQPSTAALAGALTRLVQEPGLAERLGTAGLARSKAITWEGVVKRLTAGRERRIRRAAGETRRGLGPTAAATTKPVDNEGWRTGKPKVVVLSTFVIHPARHGGQLRCWHLYRELTDRFDIEFLCLGSIHDFTSEQVVAPGIVQRVVPRSFEHHQLEVGWDHRTGMAVGDIVAGLFVDRSTEFMAMATASLRDAEAVLLAHPFLLEVAEKLAPSVPVIYDAHNSEADLKGELLGGRPGGDELLDRVEAIEGRAVRSSVVRTACSTDDAARLGERYGVEERSFLIVPNGVDVAGTEFVTGDERTRNTERFLARYSTMATRGLEHIAVFFGSWHPPNIEAGRRLLRIAPSVPDALIVLAGGHTSALPRFGLPANVAPAGLVSDLVKKALLRSATIGLNPVVQGSGTNLKLVEYLAAGLPVVTTPTGARGLPVVEGVHARLADLPEFGAAMTASIADPGRPAMATAGRLLVEESFDWARIAPRLSAAIAAALP
ncbi:MAG: glycosyltransferase [Acidimicrobiia bacterium]|nr:glycosyltransferase [Acidimicrobiia bacterium]